MPPRLSHRGPCGPLCSLVAIISAAFTAGSPPARAGAVTADPATGQVRVETPRYTARLDAGVLTYLYSKAGQRALIGNDQPPAAPGNRTGLFVQNHPTEAPVWLLPVTQGEGRSAITVTAGPGDSAQVTFTGLAPAGQPPRSGSALTLTVAVDAASGDLLLTANGKATDECVVGTGVAFSGIMQKYLYYATSHNGVLNQGDTTAKTSPLAGTLEWGNFAMGKRTGPSGWLWNAPVTVIAAAEAPQFAFALWCEDDIPKYKLYLGGHDGATYATYEYPPYDTNRATTSVTWRVNVFDGGWTTAARPYAESLVRRGFTRTRAPWAKDISVIVQVPDMAEMWWRPLEALFPPADRKHVLLYAQGWRKAGFDHDLWDYAPSEAFQKGAPLARQAGFHTLAYMQPMLCWGDSGKIQDAAFRAEVQKMQGMYSLDPLGKHPVEYTCIDTAYAPWRKLLLDAGGNLIKNYGIEGIYLDSSYTFLPDGRGRVDGLTIYEGAHALVDGLRQHRKDIFLGTEMPNELIAWGADFGLHTGLEWASGWKEGKARSSHPIVNFLFQHVMTTMTHANTPYARSVRDYHLSEEIAERTGQVAAMGYDRTDVLGNPTTPELKLWVAKAKLFAQRGLRPWYPDRWEPRVMSYLKAADGTVFVYEETEYGSRLVERAAAGPVIHYARAWKTTSVKTSDGEILNWIGRADDGTWIGLDNVNGAYVLFAKAEMDPRLRIRQLPAGVRIASFHVTDDITDLQLAGDGKQAEIRFATAKPLVRVTAPGVPSIPFTADSVTVPLNVPLALVWTRGVIAPFETSDDFVLPVPTRLVPVPGRPEYQINFGAWDQKWAAPLVGPVNPRPGTICVFSFSVAVADKPASGPTPNAFLTSGGTLGGGFFDCTTDIAPPAQGRQAVTQAGIRTTSMAAAWDRTLFLRILNDVSVADLSPVRLVRPKLEVSDTAAIDLGTVKPGQASPPSAVRRVRNSQAMTVSAGTQTYATVLYGTAHVTAPPDKAWSQSIDHAGVVLVGEQAAMFALAGEHATADGRAVQLLGGDSQMGLNGGAQPESEPFTVRFLGSDKPGRYAAVVRVVTQAGNTGVLATGKPGEPMAGLYYVDIPVAVQVAPN